MIGYMLSDLWSLILYLKSKRKIHYRNSQALLEACIKVSREAKLSKKALPLCYISGCPSSCGTHQIGVIGFRGSAKQGKPTYQLTVNGENYEDKERFGDIVGDIFEEYIPKFWVKLGQIVDKSSLGFEDWNRENLHGIIDIAKDFIIE